ncbi:MAG: 5'-3' exonuclease H3TH domain-containing protein [Opitutales bacterium]
MKYFLIDGHNLSFRSFYALPDLRNAKSFPTGALHAFSQAILRFESMLTPHKTIIFFDKGKSKRHTEIYPLYKAQRSSMPEDMRVQMPYIKEICRLMGFAIIEEEGIECDDLLASAIKKIKQEDKDSEIYIISSDKDFAQLISPKIYQLLPPKSSKAGDTWTTLDMVAVRTKFGVSPSEIVDYLALIGDTADNIEGIMGVGPKTAAKWIKEYSTLENIIKRASWIKPVKFAKVIEESAEKLLINQKLIRLDDSFEINSLEGQKIDFNSLLALFEEMSMKRAIDNLRKMAKLGDF